MKSGEYDQASDVDAPLLDVRGLVVGYGQIRVLKRISFVVQAGEMVALLGSNGAGKTTTMRALSGLLTPSAGLVRFSGRDITRMPTEQRVRAGIIAVPEGRGIFVGMTVQENLDMGCFGRKFSSKRAYMSELERVYDLFPKLAERRTQLGGTLSGGEQQMLAMGRALMSHPKLIVLDEPSMGLSPIYVNEVFDIIQSINRDGVTVLLVEQNAKKALSIANQAYVLETGKIVLSGDAKQLMNDDKVKKAYLSE